MRAVVLMVASLCLAACNQGPLCESASMRSDYMSGCTSGGTASSAYCLCTWNTLAEDNACDAFDEITFGEMMEAAESCSHLY